MMKNTDATRANAKAWWLAGEETETIAAAFQVSGRTIRRWARDGNWPLRMQMYTPDRRQDAFDQVDAGTPVQKVARALGIGRSTLRRWLASRPSSAWKCYCTNKEHGWLLRIPVCPSCRARNPATVTARARLDRSPPQ